MLLVTHCDKSRRGPILNGTLHERRQFVERNLFDGLSVDDTRFDILAKSGRVVQLRDFRLCDGDRLVPLLVILLRLGLQFSDVRLQALDVQLCLLSFATRVELLSVLEQLPLVLAFLFGWRRLRLTDRLLHRHLSVCQRPVDERLVKLRDVVGDVQLQSSRQDRPKESSEHVRQSRERRCHLRPLLASGLDPPQESIGELVVIFLRPHAILHTRKPLGGLHVLGSQFVAPDAGKLAHEVVDVCALERADDRSSVLGDFGDRTPLPVLVDIFKSGDAFIEVLVESLPAANRAAGDRGDDEIALVLRQRRHLGKSGSQSRRLRRVVERSADGATHRNWRRHGLFWLRRLSWRRFCRCL